jgi:hypothetical protein
MKQFEYTKEELNRVVYETQDAENAYQKAKDDYEILRDSSKDLLAHLCGKLDQNLPEVKLKRLARTDLEWIKHQDGLAAAKQKLGEASALFSHKKRVLKALTSGMALKREMLSKGIVDQ